MRRNVLLDLIRVLALVLIGIGVYWLLGAAPALVYAGVALLLAATVAELRERGLP
jgi:hypothetical protein